MIEPNNESRDQTFLSDAERDLLAEICAQRGLDVADVEALLDLEREMQGMARRHGINVRIAEHVERMAMKSKAQQ